MDLPRSEAVYLPNTGKETGDRVLLAMELYANGVPETSDRRWKWVSELGGLWPDSADPWIVNGGSTLEPERVACLRMAGEFTADPKWRLP